MNSTIHNLPNEDFFKLYPVVDQEKCCGDGLCVKDCIRRCLVMNSSNKAQYKAIKMDCFQCGHCIAICPKNAISFEKVDSSALLQGKIDVSPEKLDHLIRMRRSVRDFKEELVPQAELEWAIESASYAPTGGNFQEVSWTLVSSKEKIDELISLCVTALVENPHLASPKGQAVNLGLYKAYQKGRNLVSYNAPHIIFTHAPSEIPFHVVDSTIAMSYLEILLTSMGIGTCWGGYITRAAMISEKISDFLEIPKGNVVTGTLLAGYSKLKYQRSVMRKKLDLKTIK